MPAKTIRIAALVVIGLPLAASTGCMTPLNAGMPSIQGIPWPIPISPYFQKKHEDAFWNHERYERAPILGPVTSGPVMALDPPSDDEVMRALEKAQPVQAGLPLLHETQRNDVRITKELIADYIDPPRVYPLVGPAQLHHAHYKCTVYFTKVTRVGWPVPYTTKDEDSREVLYIDHNHLHMCGNVDDPGIAAAEAPPAP